MPKRIILAFRRATEGGLGMPRFLKRDHGIAITEYGLLVTLIAIVVIGVIVYFGGGIQAWFGSKSGAITSY